MLAILTFDHPNQSPIHMNVLAISKKLLGFPGDPYSPVEYEVIITGYACDVPVPRMTDPLIFGASARSNA